MALLERSTTAWKEKQIKQGAIEAIIVLEESLRLTRKQIDKIRGELIESLMQNADTEPGEHMVFLQESIKGGCLVKELMIC